MSDNQSTNLGHGAEEEHEESSENILSMVDVLEEEKQLEEDAHAVLGASDDTNCTYPQGYVHRQALYACRTCTEAISPGPGARDPAGVCLACSLECHEGHQLYELYTKRTFRCDCGNKKFPTDFKCKLHPDKTSENIDNKYNHNFKGVYCICSRPYPDPDDDIEDDMIQCVVCEDWFHGRHLGIEAPDNFDEMICGDCMKSCDFLWPYAVVTGGEVKMTPGNAETPVEICEEKTDRASNGHTHAENGRDKSGNDCESECNGEDKKSADETKTPPIEEHVKVGVACSDVGTEKSSDEVTCLLEELKQRSFQQRAGATFWKEGWRSKLCRCDPCEKMYLEKNVTFLTDETDTIMFYENRGKSDGVGSVSQYEKGMQELSKMHRTQQVDLLHGFNDMKSQLSQYLKKFAENGKVVREEDIKEFFEQMQANKKQKVSVPYFCR